MKEQRKISLNRFDYFLPKELISQKPIKPRDHARLLILAKNSKAIEHKKFYDITDYLNPGDVLVLNDSKVIPARLIGHKETEGKVEIFLLQKKSPKNWECLIGGKIKPGQKIKFNNNNIIAEVVKKTTDQSWLVKFNTSDKKIFAIGDTPLPPYIKEKSKLEDYQTVYARSSGSVAAPTAGLHFTSALLTKIKKKGVKVEYITLHIGLDTFSPVKESNIVKHKIHSEYAILNKATANRLNKAKKSGNRVIAIGTTSVRTLEAFSKKEGEVKAQSKWVNIYIYPGYQFKFIDSMITNFHLPKSTLLMLIAAFASEKLIKKSYQEAIKKKYRFYSFGDAMLIK